MVSFLRVYNKFRAKKITIDGFKFPSLGEGKCYNYLKQCERDNEIKILKLQDPIKLTKANIVFIVDFKVFDIKLNKEIWCEFKGVEPPVYRIKRRLWKAYGPGVLRVYKSKGTGVILIEEIIPSV